MKFNIIKFTTEDACHDGSPPCHSLILINCFFKQIFSFTPCAIRINDVHDHLFNSRNPGGTTHQDDRINPGRFQTTFGKGCNDNLFNFMQNRCNKFLKIITFKADVKVQWPLFSYGYIGDHNSCVCGGRQINLGFFRLDHQLL